MRKIDELKSLFVAGKAGRREFIQGAATLGLTAAMTTAFIEKTQAATPKKGGHVRIGLPDGQTVDSMDLATWVNTHQFMTGMGIHDYLTVTDGDNKLVPHLATNWEASKDASTWTFELRKGVEHSNGKTVDAHDVVASWNFHTHEDSKSSFKPQASTVEAVTADGDHTVVFKMKTASADFAFLTSDYHVPIMPAKDGKPLDNGTKIGAGPYELATFEPGVRSEIKRNPNHWNDTVGHFDSAEFLVIHDANARQNAVVTDGIDIMATVDLKTADRLDAREGVSVVQTEGRQHYTYPMRTDTPPFDDNNVRMALKHAIDREELLKKILRGRGSIGNDQPISSAYRFHDPSIEQRRYDPDKARWYLKQSGLDSLEVTLSVADAGWPGSVEGAILFRETAAKAGIDLTVDRVPDDGYWSDVWLKKPFCACIWYGRLVADEMLTVTYAAGGSWNDTYWDHPRFNALLVEARAELDEARRGELYGEMQRMIRDEGGQIIPLFANWVDAKSDKITTPEKISATQSLDGGRAVSRWWMAG